MKGRICSACFGGDIGIKKPITFSRGKAGFFSLSVSNPHAVGPFFARAVDGRALSNPYSEWYCVPSTVLFSSSHSALCGRARLRRRPSVDGAEASTFFVHYRASSYSCVGSTALRGPQPVIQRHFVKEYIVTITNHIRRIEDLASEVIGHVDAREYQKAHCALDDIEKKVRSAREHIDHLQFVTYFSLASSGRGT